jgi:hypothetical protein
MHDENMPEEATEEEEPDPRPRQRTGASVLRLRSGRLDVATIAPLLVQHLGMSRFEAATLCAHGSGIFVDNIDLTPAQALAEAMQQRGEPCFTVSAAELVPLPRAVPIHAAHLTAGDLGPLDTVGRQEKAPWDKAVALALAEVAVVEQQRPGATGGGSRPGRAVVAGAVGLGTASYLASKIGSATAGPAHTTSKPAQRVWLDLVFLHPLRRYRIDSSQFDYSVLGKQLATTGAANIQTLARWFLTYAPQMRTNLNAKALQRLGQVPLARMNAKTLNETVHWLLNLARFGKEPEPAA